MPFCCRSRNRGSARIRGGHTFPVPTAPKKGFLRPICCRSENELPQKPGVGIPSGRRRRICLQGPRAGPPGRRGGRPERSPNQREGTCRTPTPPTRGEGSGPSFRTGGLTPGEKVKGRSGRSARGTGPAAAAAGKTTTGHGSAEIEEEQDKTSSAKGRQNQRDVRRAQRQPGETPKGR